MQRIGLLFDCLRASYDVSHILQVVSALGNCDLYFMGNSIDPYYRKIISKVKSWGIKKIPSFRRFESLEEAIEQLHTEKKYLIGTSLNADKDLYLFDFTQNDSILVFGTESSGLSRRKSLLLDEIIKIPMKKECQFLTLPVAVPIATYEFYRQIMEKSKCNL